MDLNRNMEEYEIQQGDHECCPHSLSTKYQIAVYKISGTVCLYCSTWSFKKSKLRSNEGNSSALMAVWKNLLSIFSDKND